MNEGFFSFDGEQISCTGNIETLLDYKTVAAGIHPPRTFRFKGLFANCQNLVSAPSLPAPALWTESYYGMFYGCTALRSAPELPAAALGEYCYTYMFVGCTSLTTPPIISATNLQYRGCYYGMFKGCTGLTSLPDLPALEIPVNAYQDMFNGCTAIRLSETNESPYTIPYRIPTSGTGYTDDGGDSISGIFERTGGTFTGANDNVKSVQINRTYYLYSGDGTEFVDIEFDNHDRTLTFNQVPEGANEYSFDSEIGELEITYHGQEGTSTNV